MIKQSQKGSSYGPYTFKACKEDFWFESKVVPQETPCGKGCYEERVSANEAEKTEKMTKNAISKTKGHL